MRYLNYGKKINEALLKHKAEVDRLVAIHRAELKNHEAEVQAMQGIYAEGYIEQYKANWKPKADYSDAIHKSSERAVLETDLYLSKIKKELDKYFDSPVRSDFANKINAISMTGLSLKDREFALLIESAQNYMEMRLLQHLAESRTKQATVSNINEQGYTENKQVTVQNPYYVELPDIDYTYRAFDEYASSVRTMAKFYAGEKAELKEHLPCVQITLNSNDENEKKRLEAILESTTRKYLLNYKMSYTKLLSEWSYNEILRLPMLRIMYSRNEKEFQMLENSENSQANIISAKYGDVLDDTDDDLL